MSIIEVTAKAPSNIALIKYMGKTDSQVNTATNSSISFTLPHLLTTVTICLRSEPGAEWKSLNEGFHLSPIGLNKFLAHWERCQRRIAPSFSQGVIISSGNNFPSDCGLASSASSFAALTEAAHQFFSQLGMVERAWTREDLAQLSREGSGSSCRSFFWPWVYWSQDAVKPIESVWKSLHHSVVIVDETQKKVSSSEAHKRVLSSSLFEGRILRAEKRSEKLQSLLKDASAWNALYELSWSEFWDMHALFETSCPSFYYMSPKSLLALRHLQNEWELRGDGPVVTMDAGPNVHLLYRPDQRDLQLKQQRELNHLDLAVLTNQEGL